MFDVWTEHSRLVTSLMDEFSAFGGLWGLIDFLLIYGLAYFYTPFSDLKFTLSANELANRMVGKRDLRMIY